MSVSESKCWYTNNCSQFSKHAVSMWSTSVIVTASLYTYLTAVIVAVSQ
jgi:hypothetical protein